MNGDFNINISLVDDHVKFGCVSEANPDQALTFDYIPPIGTGKGLAGLEALTCSFAGCVSTAVVLLLRRAGVEVKAFKARVSGCRKEKPLMLDKIVYTAEVTADNATDEIVRGVLVRAREISPVWLSLNPAISVETEYVLKK